jgi:hypothetical protein
MPGPLIAVGAVGMCPHGGQMSIVSSNARVLAGGMAVATLADQYLIAGCAFTIPPGKPQPCVRVQWMTPATRVMVGGQPAMLLTSTGLALSAEGIPGGPPNVTSTQPRVVGT